MRTVACDLDRAVVVRGLNLVKPADNFLALGIRTVDHGSLAARPPHHSPRAILKFLTTDDDAVILQTQSPVAIFLDDCLHFRDRKSTRLNSSHLVISYAVFCLKKKNKR